MRLGSIGAALASLRALAALLVVIAIGAWPHASLAEKRFVALPTIEDSAVSPRVVYIENPRFPSVEIADLRRVLRSAAALVEAHFGVTVTAPSEIPIFHIDEVFSRVVAHKPKDFDRLIGDFRNRNVDWDRVSQSLRKQIRKERDPLAKQIAFARPYLVRPLTEQTLEAFSEAVIDTFKSRLFQWTVATLDDGHPVVGAVPGRADLPLNEYGYWALMLKLGIDAEIVLTNQLVASVEYLPTPVHTSIRGGITGGSTEFNPSSRLGSSVWVSLFPHLSNHERIRELRNDDRYTHDEALDYAGAMLAHEMGHQLFQLGHPWSNDACIMRPAEALDFAAWVGKLDPARCRIGSSPAMQPGTVRPPIW